DDEELNLTRATLFRVLGNRHDDRTLDAFTKDGRVDPVEAVVRATLQKPSQIATSRDRLRYALHERIRDWHDPHARDTQHGAPAAMSLDLLENVTERHSPTSRYPRCGDDHIPSLTRIGGRCRHHHRHFRTQGQHEQGELTALIRDIVRDVNES